MDWFRFTPEGADPGEEPGGGGGEPPPVSGEQGPGYQRVEGKAGVADVFAYRYGDGAAFPHDAIAGFEVGVDRLELPGGITAVEQGGEGLWVGYGRRASDNDWVLLEGVRGVADPGVLLAPGGSGGGGGGDWPAPEGGSLELGTAGRDVLVGEARGDVLVGGAGDDVLAGRGGPDVFGFAEGDGADRVRGFQPGVDALLFRGVDPESVSVEAGERGGRTGLVVHYGDAGDTVFLPRVEALAAGDILYA